MIELSETQAKLVVASLGEIDADEVNKHLRLMEDNNWNVDDEDMYELYEELRTELEEMNASR